MSTTPTPQTGYTCPACETFYAETELPDQVYTCGQCGDTDEERRCGDCNRFKARADGEHFCPDCFEECEEVDAVLDVDGALIAAEDYNPGASLASRKAAVDAADAAAREEQDAAARAAAHQTSNLIPWADVRAGHILLVKSYMSEVYDHADVLAVWSFGDHVLAVVDHFGGRFALHPATEEVRAHAASSPREVNFGDYTMAESWNGFGSMNNETICVFRSNMAIGAKLPCLVMYATTPHGGIIHHLGVWVDTQSALTAFENIDHAAHALASDLGVTAVADDTNVDVARADPWVAVEPWARVDMALGRNDITDTPMAVFSGSRTLAEADHSMPTVIQDPNVLLGATRAARSMLDGLMDSRKSA